MKYGTSIWRVFVIIAGVFYVFVSGLLYIMGEFELGMGDSFPGSPSWSGPSPTIINLEVGAAVSIFLVPALVLFISLFGNQTEQKKLWQRIAMCTPWVILIILGAFHLVSGK